MLFGFSGVFVCNLVGVWLILWIDGWVLFDFEVLCVWVWVVLVVVLW